MTNEELNKAVAEKVMGECWHDWRLTKPEDITEEFVLWKCQLCDKEAWGELSPDKPNYCESISDTWKIVEKFKYRNLYFSINTACNYVEINENGGTAPNPIVKICNEKAIPMAIVLASLKVVEDKK